MLKMTISELSKELGISTQATWKKVKKLVESNKLTTTKEIFNNREITLVILSDDELKDLILTTNPNRLIEQPVDNQLRDVKNEELLTKIMTFTENIHSEMKILYREISDKDNRIRLLEDSENRTNLEYQETHALIKELREKLSVIDAENNNLKTEITHKNKNITELTDTISVLTKEKELLFVKNSELQNDKNKFSEEIVILNNDKLNYLAKINKLLEDNKNLAKTMQFLTQELEKLKKKNLLTFWKK